MFEKIREKIFFEKRRPEHLKKGINPITARIRTPEQFEKYHSKEKEIKDAYYKAEKIVFVMLLFVETMSYLELIV